MSALNLLGIYPMQLENASDVIAEACAEQGVNDDELWRSIWQEMDELYGTEHDSLSNRLVGIMFRHLSDALRERGVQSTYYINGGLDTHFYIDGKEVWA